MQLEPGADGWTVATLTDASDAGTVPWVSPSTGDTYPISVYGEGATLADALEALALRLREYPGVEIPACEHANGYETNPADPDEGDMTPVTACVDCGTRWGR